VPYSQVNGRFVVSAIPDLVDERPHSSPCWSSLDGPSGIGVDR
jgi:hypothetical protein